jgi:peptidoglycan/LPS O-acetylase OafA/YrhL
MMSLERMGLEGARLYSTFYARRIFRIYPLSILAVAIVVGAHIPQTSWTHAYEYPSLSTIVSNFFLVQTPINSVIGPLWSLPLEVQMYLLLPILFVLIRRSVSIKPLIGVWVVFLAIGLLQTRLAAIAHLTTDRIGIAEYAPCFLAGVTAYYVLSRKRTRTTLPLWVWPLTLGVITTAYLCWQARVGFVGYIEWACCLPVGLMVTQCAESTHKWLNWLTHNVAKYSYGLYLGQVPILWLASDKLNYLPRSLRWPLFPVLIILVPVASYYLIERPFIKMGAKLTALPSPKRVVGEFATGGTAD